MRRIFKMVATDSKMADMLYKHGQICSNIQNFLLSSAPCDDYAVWSNFVISQVNVVQNLKCLHIFA